MSFVAETNSKVEEIKENLSITRNQLRKADLIVSDIYHSIEMDNISGREMLILTSNLKKALNARRDAKIKAATLENELANFMKIKISMEKLNSEANAMKRKDYALEKPYINKVIPKNKKFTMLTTEYISELMNNF